MDQCSNCIFGRTVGAGAQLFCRQHAPPNDVAWGPNGPPVANDYWCGDGVSAIDGHNFSDLLVGVMWNSYVPTVTPDSGAFTAVTATGKYWQAGKTVAFYGSVVVTTNGTAGGDISYTLPIAPLANAVCQVGFGVQSVAGSILVAGAKVTFPSTHEDGNTFYLCGMYEAA